MDWVAACKKVSNVTAMKRTAVMNWTQLSVRWLLLLQLLSMSQNYSASQSHGDGRPSSSSSAAASWSRQRQHDDDDLSSIPENCTARQVHHNQCHHLLYHHHHCIAFTAFSSCSIKLIYRSCFSTNVNSGYDSNRANKSSKIVKK